MHIQKAFGLIENNQQKYTDFLAKICAFEATAKDKAEIDRMIDYIDSFAKGEGFITERTAFSKCGDFLTIEFNPGKEKTALLLAHTDTVHPKGTFGYPAVRIEDGKMIAPGAIDCKGGIAIALLSMIALKESGYQKHIRLILTSDEEVSNSLGGDDEIEFFRKSCEGFPIAINCETTENNEVVISRRGVLKYAIEVRGVGGHAGIHYFDCKNPIFECAHKIIKFESLSKKGGITYSCNMINSGIAFNVIPDVCTFSVDVRVSKKEEIAEAERNIKAICDEQMLEGTYTTAVKKAGRLPMEANADTIALFERLKYLSEKHGLGQLTAVHSGGGSDSAFTQAFGAVSICGMGGCGEFCHTSNEYIYLESIPRRAKLITALLLEDK